jgi:hypothetical protein
MFSQMKLALTLTLSGLLCLPAPALERWLYHSTNLLVGKNIDALETLWRRASAAGYTHVLLADSKFSRLEEMASGNYPNYFKHIDRVKRIAAETKLEIVPALFSIGYSNDLLAHDPNLIEALPVKELPLVVQGGVARVDDPDAPRLPADFSDPKKWGSRDERVTIEDGALHVNPGMGNARIFQKLKLTPWREYHVSVRIKTRDFNSTPEIKVLADRGNGESLQWDNLGVKPTQDWTVHHVTFNSQRFTSANLIFGIWDDTRGNLWWSEPKIEEVAFVNLVRRPGTPLTLATADGKPLVEGRDFEPLSDPLLGAKPWKGEYDSYHQPPMLMTKLADGTKLKVSYYHGATVYDHQAMICLSEPKTYELLRDQARRMHAAWGAKGYMMSHDEIRVANWCAACEARQMTPGQLVADNVKRCIDILHEANPGGRIYTWSDMFDPNHNAVNGPYYLVNGPLTGSWEGLSKEVIVLPWYYERRKESLKFFADRGHKQVIAGYYDAEPGKVRDWLDAAKGVPGSVVGVMYTTWRGDYANIEKFGALVE